VLTYTRRRASQSLNTEPVPNEDIMAHFGTGAEVSSETLAPVPKCLGAEVSWGRSRHRSECPLLQVFKNALIGVPVFTASAHRLLLLVSCMTSNASVSSRVNTRLPVKIHSSQPIAVEFQ